MAGPQRAGSRLVLAGALLALLAGPLLLPLPTESQQQQDSGAPLCSASLIGSFLCRAGQAVVGGATRLAGNLLTRPKHWGVPENEPLELADDFNRVGPNQGPPNNNNHHHHHHQDEEHPPPPPPPPRPNSEEPRGRGRKRERVYCQTPEGERGVCRPLTACYHRHGPGMRYVMDSAQCPGGLSLVCCPKRPGRPQDRNQEQQFSALQLAYDAEPRQSQAQQQARGQVIALEALRDIISQVFSQSSPDSQRQDEIERNVISDGVALRRDSPSDLHQRFIQLRNGKLVGQMARDGGDFLAVATRVARERQQQPDSGPNDNNNNNNNNRCPADGSQSGETECPPAGPGSSRRVGSLPEIDFSRTELASRCPGDPVCGRNAARERYRTYDGSCNNLQHTAWGKSNTPYTRILAPDYEDGVSELRATGVTGRKLPNPRSLSLATIRWSERADARATVMLMQWGQFLDHDLSLAATTPMLTPQGTNIDCCNRRLLSGDPRFKHPACISILLPDNDPFYARFNVGCMNLVRNAPSPPIGCRLRAREQLNQLTHFIDGSQVYGNDEQQALGLRQFSAGLLKSSRINGMEFLPFDGRLGEGCILPTAGVRRGMRCFVAGDGRVNELTGLVTSHALFLREHNRVARLLARLNPHWLDETIYQETRRIVVAQIQHITYEEFLPLIVGPVVMRDFKLELSQTNGGYAYDYDKNTDPSIINEFAGAAYRLHSLVQGAFNFQTHDGQLIQSFKLRHIFNNPASLYRDGNYDACIHSMINEPSQSLDNHFTEELTNHLFQDTNSSFGMDLVAVNVQRGRDHGIPGYNFFRQACGLSKLESFRQLDGVMSEGAGQVFAQLYAHVDDIDLFIAGNYEKKLKDAMVGPVFACIIGEQFRRLKLGDRYWYENGNQAGAFSPGQLAELKRASLARIICDNSDQIQRVQPLAFIRHSDWNPKLTCDHIPRLDLRHWQTSTARGDDFDPFAARGPSASRKLDGEPEQPASEEALDE